MNQLEPEVERKLALIWPDDNERTKARTVLSQYGEKSYQREPQRVRLAIIKLSEGSLDELKRMTKEAEKDYRDVLMWAEYPEESKALWACHPNLTEDEVKKLKRIRKRDWKQYDDWLGK